MNQRIAEGTDIFPELISEINKSQSELLVASAWFTDQDLFNALLRKQKKGVKIKLIIADNEDNAKIDFSKLSRAGGDVYKVKNKGFGMMHKKYCVIDEKVAIHGSYNWTYNARKNNQESVIITDHPDTVDELKNGFNRMEMEINETGIQVPLEKTRIKNKFFNFFKTKKKQPENQPVDSKQEIKYSNPSFRSVDDDFETIVSSEIKNIDRQEIRILGKESAQTVNGDEGVLSKSMDSLYQIFISDSNQVEERKNALKSKVDTKTEELIANYNIDNNRRKNIEEEQVSIKEKTHNERFSVLDGNKKTDESRINYIQENIIPEIQQKIEKIKAVISELQVEFVKPKIKYFELIPLLFFLLGLGTALFLFYSSSAYIMLFAKEDAIKMISEGLQPTAQVFNAQAISLAAMKGGTALAYILVFVFIPFTVAYIAHKGNIAWKVLGILTIILLDIFIAYKVSDTIREIKFLADGIVSNEPFYLDINLWIVFTLSALPFIFFIAVINKTLAIFEARHPESGKEKADFKIKKHKENIEILEEQIKEINDEKQSLKTKIIEIENEIDNIKSKLSYLAQELPRILNMIEENFNDKIRYLQKKADVYKNNIDNDNVPISFSALKDRVNIFLEGWNEWLHEELALPKAVSHSENARIEANKWLDENIESNKVYTLKKAS